MTVFKMLITLFNFIYLQKNFNNCKEIDKLFPKQVSDFLALSWEYNQLKNNNMQIHFYYLQVYNQKFCKSLGIRKCWEGEN